jgi:hypothetical protein
MEQQIKLTQSKTPLSCGISIQIEHVAASSSSIIGGGSSMIDAGAGTAATATAFIPPFTILLFIKNKKEVNYAKTMIYPLIYVI